MSEVERAKSILDGLSQAEIKAAVAAYVLAESRKGTPEQLGKLQTDVMLLQIANVRLAQALDRVVDLVGQQARRIEQIEVGRLP